MHVWKQKERSQVELHELFGLEAATVTSLVQKLLEEMIATKGGFHD